ncbi:hypothetical protein [Terriglobus tenax]|uniref:hypothetical protein n=1 Tax=Terriglobus tenax TaxID=1111115 RepID=UPI0021E04D6D|nr:hypothetical protein [Terriglobus tenax]
MEPLRESPPSHSTPRFYVSERQPLRRGSILMAMVAAAVALFAVSYALSHNGHIPFSADKDEVSRSSAGASASRPPANDEDDDPNQIDTIVLADPADAPVPARKGNHVSPVHPTLLIRLPRSGSQAGMIPDSQAGHLLYNWLAAFNQESGPALAQAIPTLAGDEVVAAQLAVRKQSGGFALLSAKEIEPGLIVFRVHSQIPPTYEVLGTLQMRKDSNPAEVASFSLRAIPPTHPVKSE